MKKLLFVFLILGTSFLTLSAQSWYALGMGINGAVTAVDSFGGNLYAGGRFDTAGRIGVNNIAKWNGATWAAVGTGVTCRYNQPEVWVLQVYNGNLYAGGIFDTAGGMPANNIAEWNGFSWQSLGIGVNGAVYGLAVYGGNLVVAGSFSNAGGIGVKNIAKWNGATWSAFSSGTNAQINTLNVYNGNLYAGGLFDSAGGTRTNYIAKWNGVSWSSLGSGTNNWIYTLTTFNGNLYAGGWFTQAGGSPANYIAKWDGSTWSALGSGMGNMVLALQVYNGDLIVGGNFSTAGGNPAHGIALWNGTIWSSLGGGVKSGTGSLAVLNGNLYAGGGFDSAGGKPANRIAEWCSGNCPAGVSEVSSFVSAFSVYPNPNGGKFTVELNFVKGKSQVEIYNIIGEQIYTGKLNATTTQLDLSNNAAGIYLYRVLTETGDLVSEGKFIIQK